MSAVAETLSRPLVVGHHYFVAQSRRVDSFRHKRYCDPSLEQWQRLHLMGRLVEQRGEQIKLHLDGNGFERDGEAYVFTTGQLLTAPGGDIRCLEVHGKPDLVLGSWA